MKVGIKNRGNWPHTGNCWACKHWQAPVKERIERGIHDEVLWLYNSDAPATCVNLHQLAKHGETRHTDPMDSCDQYDSIGITSKILGG